MSDVNEVPTYQPPAGVNGPTLGRDLPDGCERCVAHVNPRDGDHWRAWHDGARVADLIYWWRFPPLQVGDRVQLTGTVTQAHGHGFHVVVDHDPGHQRWFQPAALTRVVDQ